MVDLRLSALPELISKTVARRQFSRLPSDMRPLWERIRESAAAAPSRPMVIDEAGVWSGRDLWRRCCDTALVLRRARIGKNQTILVQLPNWREFAELMVAAELTSTVFAFCPASWGVRETAQALRLIRPSLWFCGHDDSKMSPGDQAKWLAQCIAESEIDRDKIVVVRSRELGDFASFEQWRAPGYDDLDPDLDPDRDAGRGSDLLEIAVTSGTTGDPKGVLHTHDSALSAVQSTIDRQGIVADDIVHVALPIGHTFGYLYGVRCALQAGATLLLQSRWNAGRAAETIAKFRATVSLGPSAFLVDMLELDDAVQAKLGSLRLFTQSGDSLPGPVIERLLGAFSFRLSRALGMTEFGHAASADALTPRERIIDSVGSPQPEMIFEIRDPSGKAVGPNSVGSIHVAGPFLFTGYLRNDRLDPDVIAADGFFATGDLGWIGDDGCLHVTGREKNIIRRGAITVPVATLEDAIAAHPSVAHTVVVPLPDLRLGEVTVACIKMKPSCAALSLTEVHDHLDSSGMTRTFWPELLLVVDDWPLGPTAKIDRSDLIRQAEQQRAATNSSPMR